MDSLLEPLYAIRLEEVFWGGTLVAVTMAVHGFGMLLVLRVAGLLKHRFDTRPSFLKGMIVLILASWMILIIHLFEVFAWALFFLQTKAVNSPNCNASLCYYFALMDYTTLGSNYNLVLRWRLLEGMIAIAGLLTFAWSTGVLLTFAQAFQEQEMELIKNRHKKSTAPPERGPTEK
jgi:hypothetical protein